MTRKLIVVAIATVMFATLPTLLTAAFDPEPAGVLRENSTTLTAVQPEPDYPPELFEPAYPEPDWALLERCWVPREQSGSPPPAGCSGSYPLALPCHWTVGYPSREWVVEACGDPAGWGPDFGFGWYGHWNPHPGRDWVERLRAGGQP